MKKSYGFAIAALLLHCSPGLAYVDPGIPASLFQLVYVFVFGVLMTVVFRPYQWLNRVFKKSRGNDARVSAE